jgi:tRNA(Ile)-lysidine synthase TilS/MesJ
MKANYKIEAGDVRVIRPLVYVREHSTRDFSQQAKLPIINENCPACFEQPKVSIHSFIHSFITFSPILKLSCNIFEGEK